jgi:hypothetical protein
MEVVGVKYSAKEREFAKSIYALQIEPSSRFQHANNAGQHKAFVVKANFRLMMTGNYESLFFQLFT